MCKRSVLENYSLTKLPGLFTILLVITLLAIAKPGVCSPRFVYSDSSLDRNLLAKELESVSTDKRGLQAIFSEGQFSTEELLKLLPFAVPSVVSGGVFADLSDEQLELLNKMDPSVVTSETEGVLKQTETTISETNNLPAQWNFIMSGVDTIKNFYSLKGRNRTLGVISLDYPYGHVSLQGRIKAHKLFGEPKNDRGMKDLYLVHPMGIIAGNEPTMFEGIAPECNVVLAQISSKAAKAITLLEAIEWLLSLETPPDAILICTDFASPAPVPVKRALIACRNAGVIPIIAAGNNPNSITGMAALPCCVTVGSLDRWKHRALYSGAGPAIYEGQQIMKPDCMEPGDAVLGPTEHIEYKFGSGTLQAAAHFAGIFLLVKEALPPETDPETIVNALLTKSDDIGDAGMDNETGYGIPNPVTAINFILYPPAEDDAAR